MILPSRVALSIRQPWAWLIVKGFKDVENRTWMTMCRGVVLIHASQGMTRDEYDECQAICGLKKIILPYPAELPRGGIVGCAKLVDCVFRHDSFWFSGRWGFVFKEARELPFMPCRGMLGIFHPILV